MCVCMRSNAHDALSVYALRTYVYCTRDSQVHLATLQWSAFWAIVSPRSLFPCVTEVGRTSMLTTYYISYIALLFLLFLGY